MNMADFSFFFFKGKEAVFTQKSFPNEAANHELSQELNTEKSVKTD